MRVKKQKRHRRAVRFYTACFGFREPFKVFCDGTLVNHLVVNRITPADTKIGNILGGSVKLFTSRCVLAELKSLGSSYSEALSAAESLIIARCEHEKRKSAVDCITDIIGENNPEHFFVATQDADLRKKLQQIPGVPVIYSLRNALLLERPSASQKHFAKSAEEERSHMTELELKMLKMKKRKRLATEAEVSFDPKEGDEDGFLVNKPLEKDGKRKRDSNKDRVQFKRKKAKGPNPLSCKKKTTKGNTNASAEKDRKSEDGTVRSRRRKRRTDNESH